MPVVNLVGAGQNDQGGAATLVHHVTGGASGATDQGGAGVLTLVRAPSPPPAGSSIKVIRRRSSSWTAPAVDPATGVLVKQTPTLIAAEDVGYYQILVNNKDLTRHRGKRTRLGRMTWAVPGGPETLTLIFPAARPSEDLATALGIGRLIDGCPVAVYLRDPADDHLITDWAWEGLIHNPRPIASGDKWRWEADVKGFLHETENYVHKPAFEIYSQTEVDIGHRVFQILDNAPGRHYHHVPLATIGIGTLQRGSLSENKLAAVRELLALAWTTDGRQYRVIDVPGPGRRSVINLPGIGVDYHVTLGQFGLDVSGLTSEYDELPNVVYGEYTDKDGNRSQNIKYPREHEDTAPVYPLPPGAVPNVNFFIPGGSHVGFAPFAEWLREHGYAIYSGDTYDARDEDEVRQAQQFLRVTVDGDVGAQTWGQAFNTGGDTGDLGKAFFAPLAADPRTQPVKLTPDGQNLGPNPDYDPNYPVHETYLNFGSGLTRREVLKAARAIVSRNTTGYNLAGDVTLTGDAEECSRMKIRHGGIIAIRELAGSGHAGVPFHIATVSHDDPESNSRPVTLTLDTKHRDAPTLAQLAQNRREARNDPARQLRIAETGHLSQSKKTPFDLDNGAGRIRTHTIQGGFWRVVRFSAADYGIFADMVATTSPAEEFTLGLFVKPVTPNYLAAKVPHPLDPTSDRPWDVNRADLKTAGLIQAWGSGVQPGGYSNGYTGAKSAGDPLTGRIEDNTPTQWASFRPPWLWLAEYAKASTDLTVLFRNAPEQV